MRFILSAQNRRRGDGMRTTTTGREPGDPHPYVIGTDSVRRYLKVAEECAIAGMMRLP